MVSKLATFRTDSDTWESFQAKAKDNGTNASALLQKYLRDYLDSRIDRNLDKTPINYGIDENLDSRIDERIDNKLESILQRIASLEKNEIAPDDSSAADDSSAPDVLPITYEQNHDCSISLESIKGIEIKDLMILKSWELKEVGLKREYDEVVGKVKFFAINPLPIKAIATSTSEATASAKKPTESDRLEGEALPIIEAIEATSTAAPDAVVNDKATAPAKAKSITYQIAKDGSIVLRSLRGTDSRTLKKMNDSELKAIGLFKTLIGKDEKFFPI